MSRRRVDRNVVALGWVSFFTDTASEMILPLLPLFLTSVLGAGRVTVGAIEGVAEATTALVKLGSGWLTDRIRRPKRLVLLGYALSNLVKPVLSVCTSWGQVMAVRFADRVGKGTRTAPRDAMIATSAAPEVRGRSFGLHRAMDTAGAVMGSLIAFLVLSVWQGAFRTVFALSIIPGIMALVILARFVEEREPPAQAFERRPATSSRRYPFFLLVLVMFTFSHISYAFYILRAHELGVGQKWIPIVYLLYNVVYALLATPVGLLSDRYGRSTVLTVGFVANAALLAGFGFAERVWQVWVLFAFYGLVSAVVETVPRALVADVVSVGKRGMGYGLYHALVGLLPLPANMLLGSAWEVWGARTAFSLWAAISLATALIWIAGSRLVRTSHARA